MMSRCVLSILLLLFPTFLCAGNDNANAVEARRLFNKVYDLVFGKEGSSLTYSVNIIGLYKTQGNIVYKGKKLYYMESRYASWQDGVTAYMVDKKKKTIGIYNVDDDKKDAYLAKFKYDVNNFDFSYKTSGDYYEITAKVKNSSFFGIKRVTAMVHRKTLYPVSMNIKLAFISTTVKISNFKSGNINDKVFVFPKSKYVGYTVTDNRGK